MFFLYIYIYTICASGPSEENAGLPWRLDSDRDIVARDKTPIPLCELMRTLTVEQGLVDVDVEFHVLAQKRHPAASAFWSRSLGNMSMFGLAECSQCMARVLFHPSFSSDPLSWM